MSFRTALATFVVAVSLGVATADDNSTTNGTSTAPTSAPTVTSYPTSAPTTTGSSFSQTIIPSGAVCILVYDVAGFTAGDQVLIGNKDSSTITSKKPGGTCTPNGQNTRRLAGAAAGTLTIDPATTQLFPKGTPVERAESPYSAPTCFPGDATVNVYGRGATNMASLLVGDLVLVESGAFEPVLSFLHKVPGKHESLTVLHAHGTFRASENHIVFVASGGDKPVSALRPGDQLLVDGMPSLVLAASVELTTAGMYAPLTSSGALVVDGVVASNYGAPSSGLSLPHAAAHASFFALRMFHNLGLGKISSVGAEATMHPFAAMMFQQLRLDKHLMTAA